jgi:hypothetical protein
MTHEEAFQMAVDALLNSRGDDHILARAAFRGMTPEKMQEDYHAFGRTRQAILDGYELRVARIDEALRLLLERKP